MGLASSCWRRLLEEVVGYTPRISALECEQFCTRHVEYLPSVKPCCCIILSVRLFKMGPNLFFAGVHLR